MPKEPLDFSYDISRMDRAALLEEAAHYVDALRSPMGPGAVAPETPEGALLRDLVEDKATLPGKLTSVYRLTEKYYTDRNKPVPLRFRELAKSYKFFEVGFPVGLQPRHNWGFDRLDCKVVFSPEDLSAWQILPDKKFQEMAKVGMHLEIELDENFELAAKAGGNVGVAAAQAEAKAGGSAGASIAAGPFNYRFTKARIDHSGTGLEWVFWRLDGKEFFQETRPDLVVIVQVPKDATEFKVTAAIQAYRFFNFATADLQDALKRLGGALATFFKAGAPLPDSKSYDLTPFL